MDDSYYEATPAYMGRGLKVYVLLLVLRVPNPASWAAFISTNPGVRAYLQRMLRARLKDPGTVDRRVRKLANFVSAVLLYTATRNNARCPKDYLSLCLCDAYYGTLVPPSSPIVVSPTTARFSKLSSYNKDGWVASTYRHKHWVVFPFLCGSILANYLTPTSHQSSHSYLPGFIRTRILDPIWVHFHMDKHTSTLHLGGLLTSYGIHNGVLLFYMMMVNFRTRLWSRYARLLQEDTGPNKHSLSVLSDYLRYCAHRANAVANFIYTPNLLSMLLLSTTSSMLTSFKPLRKVYLNNQKTVLKLYMRAIGSAAGLSAMLLSLIDFNPNILFRGSTLHQKVPQKPPQKVPPTTIDPSEGRDLEPGFYNTINKYLLQLVVLSKWRMLKENHPWFTLLKVGTWRRMETAVMCYLVWKLMNLNDYIYKNASGLGNKQILHLRHNPWIKAVDRIMN